MVNIIPPRRSHGMVILGNLNKTLSEVSKQAREILCCRIFKVESGSSYRLYARVYFRAGMYPCFYQCFVVKYSVVVVVN